MGKRKASATQSSQEADSKRQRMQEEPSQPAAASTDPNNNNSSRPDRAQQPKAGNKNNNNNKRTKVQGHLRRLGTSATSAPTKINRVSGSHRRNVNLRGNKVNFGLGTGGFEGVSKAARGGAGVLPGTQHGKAEEMWVTRKKAGFAFLLKRALGAFVFRGCSALTIRAMGAAIPVALTLALAVPDQLPCASQGVQLQVMTGSTDCFDEIAPTNADGEEDEEQDPQYQTRVKSTITVHLTLQKRTSTRKENGAEQVTAGRRQQGRTAAAAQTETASESEPSSDTDG